MQYFGLKMPLLLRFCWWDSKRKLDIPFGLIAAVQSLWMVANCLIGLIMACPPVFCHLIGKWDCQATSLLSIGTTVYFSLQISLQLKKIMSFQQEPWLTPLHRSLKSLSKDVVFYQEDTNWWYKLMIQIDGGYLLVWDSHTTSLLKVEPIINFDHP